MATPTAEVRRVPANGIDFAYLEAGPEDGPLALCLHGFPDHALTFRHLLPELGSVAACGAGMLEPERMARQRLITDWDQMKRSWCMWHFQLPGIYEMAISADDCPTRASRACRDGATGRGTTSNAARC
jgi:pimeloyl-ACP methyl ester carboxylesterase